MVGQRSSGEGLGAERPDLLGGVVDDGHAEPLGGRGEVERRARKGHADLALAGSLGLDLPAGESWNSSGEMSNRSSSMSGL